MKIIKRYITKTLLIYTLAVMVIWLSIYGFFNLIGEVNHIGNADYTFVKAMIYVGFDLPSVLYAHAPMIILIGCVLALGHLVSTCEIVVLRAAGLSIMDITKIVVQWALIFIVGISVMGEGIAPTAFEYAEESRAKALGHSVVSKNQQGFWIKDKDYFLNVEKNFDGKLFHNITLIKLNAEGKLDEAIFAQQAHFDGHYLDLIDATIYKPNQQLTAILFNDKAQHKIQVSFNQSFIQSLKKKPDALPIWRLFEQMSFLVHNDLNADKFAVAFYQRLSRPLALIAMILLSALFIFSSRRETSMGKNIFLGVVLSLSFEMIFRFIGVVSLRFDVNHFFSNLTPILIILLLAMVLLQQKSNR